MTRLARDVGRAIVALAVDESAACRCFGLACDYSNEAKAIAPTPRVVCPKKVRRNISLVCVIVLLSSTRLSHVSQAIARSE